jgi:dTMP kinase
MPFIVFEGLDGSGKTTLLNRLGEHLRAQKVAVVTTREPGGTPLGEKIRDLLLTKGGDEPVERAEVLLYEASRAQHVDRLIRPALAQGAWVLCDRFSASTMAFQWGGRKLDRTQIAAIDQFATADLRADLTVLLDLSVTASAERKRTFALDRLESQPQDFHERVRTTYLKLASEDSSWITFDSAKRNRDEMFSDLLQALRERKWLD